MTSEFHKARKICDEAIASYYYMKVKQHKFFDIYYIHTVDETETIEILTNIIWSRYGNNRA